MLCHNVLFCFFFLPIKYEECCKWADTARVNQSWRQRRSSCSLLSRTGRSVSIASKWSWKSTEALFKSCPSYGWNLYLNVTAKNGTTWQSIRDLLPSFCCSCKPSLSRKYQPSTIFKANIFADPDNNLLSCYPRNQEENLLLLLLLQFWGSAVRKYLKNPDSIFR